MRQVFFTLAILVYLMAPAISQNPFIRNDSIIFIENTLKKVSKNVNFTVIPGPTFGASQKLGLAVLPMIVYNLDKTDTISPPSSTAILGYFDFYGSWLTALQQSFYWDHNRWRAFVSAGVSDLKLKYFGIGRDTVIIDNNDTNYVWTSQRELFINATCFRRIFSGLYAGLECRYTFSDFVGEDSVATQKITAGGLPVGKISQTELIPTLVWDNRDNIFWSTKGYYASLSFQVSNRVLFSSNDYTLFFGKVNGYHNLLRHNKRLTLAWHFYGQLGWGNFPYHIYANYGKGDDATGYTGGKYVNFSETTVQAELRYDLWKFVALGGYAGTGKVFTSFEVFGQSAWLHFGGVRLYLNIMPNRNIRVMLDMALSRKDYGFYIGIGQAF